MIEYRRAPEHPYPAAVEDTLSAVVWATEHAAAWGGDTARLALGGDSARVNLVAVAANRFFATAEAYPLCVLLLYPVTDHPSASHPSYTENAVGYDLEAITMRWRCKHYAPGVSSNDSDTSPLQLQKVPALPSILIATAEYDVLHDEGLVYAEKLGAAGVATTHLYSPDMNHSFPGDPATVARFPQCDIALTDIAGCSDQRLRSPRNRNLSKELGPRQIAVNVVAPGMSAHRYRGRCSARQSGT